MKTRNVSFVVTEEQYHRMVSAANANGTGYSEFMRTAVDRAAAKKLGVKLDRQPAKRRQRS